MKEKLTRLNIATILFLLAAVFCLVMSMVHTFSDGHTNWYLPLALFFNCIASFLNLIQLKKKEKSK